MSSYDELVQLPISAAEIASTKPLPGARTSAARAEMGRARSGEPGPITCGSSAREVEPQHAVVVLLRALLHLGVGREQVRSMARSTSGTSAPRSVAWRYASIRSSAGNIEVVAPSSAPMLVMVALPVALSVRAPGPMYSTIALVPPATPSCAGDPQDDVLGRGPTAQLAGQVHRDAARVQQLPRQPGDDLDRVRAADAHRAGAEAAGVGRVRIGADDHARRGRRSSPAPPGG